MRKRLQRWKADAIVDFSKSIEIDPDNEYRFAWRGRTYNDLGDLTRAAADFAKVEELLKKGESRPAYIVASGFALSSLPSEACRWLRLAFERDKEFVNEVRSEPDFDLIRDTPEFKALMAEFGGEEKLSADG